MCDKTLSENADNYDFNDNQNNTQTTKIIKKKLVTEIPAPNLRPSFILL